MIQRLVLLIIKFIEKIAKQSGCGGGVLLYIHCSLNFTLCDYLNDLYIMDSLWGTIELTPNETLLVGVVYRSPSSNNCNND